MYFSMLWFVPGRDESAVLQKANQILQAHGAAQVEAGASPEGLEFSYPFRMLPVDGPAGTFPVYLRTVRDAGGDGCVLLDVWCPERVLYRENYGQENLRWLICLGDDIFSTLKPIFGHAVGEGEMSQGLNGLLRTGLPPQDQFVYISKPLLVQVGLDSAKLEQHTKDHGAHLVFFGEIGCRIENRASPHLSSLDLP